MDADLITISEFSKRAGLSRQAIYKKLDTSLLQYVVNVDGQKMIKRQGLQAVHRKASTGSVKSDITKTDGLYIDSLLDTITILKEQLHVKDGQIQGINNQISEKDSQLSNKDEQIQGLQRLLDQQQRLQAAQHAPALPAQSGIWSRLFGKKDK